MLCLKRHHLALTLSLLALFAVPFLCSSGSVFASSSTSFTYDSTSDPKPNQIYWTADNSYNNLGFTPTYVYIEGTATRNDTQISIARVSHMAFGGYQSVYIVPDSDLHFSALINMPWGLNGQFTNISSITFTFYDYNPFTNEPCPECPPIPETPYGDILNKIYTAILAVSATALCIYFFYAFYNMFFGGIKR